MKFNTGELGKLTHELLGTQVVWIKTFLKANKYPVEQDALPGSLSGRLYLGGPRARERPARLCTPPCSVPWDTGVGSDAQV